MRLPTLRTIADGSLIVASLLVAALAGQMYLHPGPRTPQPRIVEPKQRVVLQGVDFKQNQRTLLLVLSSKCPYCEKSMPFYSKMMASKSRNSQVVVVGGEDQKVLSNYMKLHDLTVDNVATVTGKSTPSEITPTAILVDAQGVVSKVWRGQLSPEGEAEVLQLMSQY